jgi:adenylate cyclase
VVRVIRHFAFVDLSGFTALTDEKGDEVAVSVVTSFRAMLREVCSRRGVRIAKWLGDGAMLVAVEPTPLLAVLLELNRVVGIARLPVPLRCGACSGEVILLEGDDYVGNPVNVAARLCDLAPGEAALVTSSIAGQLPKWGTVLSTEDMVIRGIGRSLRVCRIGFRELQPPVAADPICGIPLTREVAEERVHDRFGHELWFCSDSCRDTWERRPQPVGEGQGSLRTPLIGT